MYVFTIPVLNVGSHGLKLTYQPEKKNLLRVSFRFVLQLHVLGLHGH